MQKLRNLDKIICCLVILSLNGCKGVFSSKRLMYNDVMLPENYSSNHVKFYTFGSQGDKEIGKINFIKYDSVNQSYNLINKAKPKELTLSLSLHKLKFKKFMMAQICTMKEQSYETECFLGIAYVLEKKVFFWFAYGLLKDTINHVPFDSRKYFSEKLRIKLDSSDNIELKNLGQFVEYSNLFARFVVNHNITPIHILETM